MITSEVLRGKLELRDSSIFKVDNLYYNDYNPTEEAIAINRQRIKERTK